MAALGNRIGASSAHMERFVSADSIELVRRSPATAGAFSDEERRGSGPESYVDAKEGAAFLRIHPKTLMRLAREGDVPAYAFSEGTRRHWRFLISELDKWMRTKVNSSAHPVRPCPANGRRK
jgi:excisionase family DNA binding protein